MLDNNDNSSRNTLEQELIQARLNAEKAQQAA